MQLCYLFKIFLRPFRVGSKATCRESVVCLIFIFLFVHFLQLVQAVVSADEVPEPFVGDTATTLAIGIKVAVIATTLNPCLPLPITHATTAPGCKLYGGFVANPLADVVVVTQ